MRRDVVDEHGLNLKTLDVVSGIDFYDNNLHHKTQSKYASIFANFAN